VLYTRKYKVFSLHWTNTYVAADYFMKSFLEKQKLAIIRVIEATP